MGEIKEITEIFGRTFRLLGKLQSEARNRFFYSILKKEAEDFQNDFFNFLKNQFSIGGAGADMVRLVCRIKNIVNILSAARSNGLISSVSALSLEKELLKLEVFTLGLFPKVKVKKVVNMVAKKEDQPLELSNLQKELLDFISARPIVLKSEILEKFSNKSERSIRRAISYLMDNHLIRREESGNKVLYGKL